MKLSTYHKVPVEIEITDEEESKIVSEVLYKDYWEYSRMWTDDERKAFAHVYHYYSAGEIDRLKR